MSRAVHFEIHASDPQAAITFYGGLFGWTFNKWEGGDYWMIHTGPDEQPGINGGLMPRRGDLPAPLPMIGGHEGAGIVQEVGPGVQGLKPGDHVVASFLPACGRCRFCSTGHQNLCDLGALIMAGTQADGTHRRRARGQNVGVMAFVGTFSQYGTVPEASIVKIDDDLPLETVALAALSSPPMVDSPDTVFLTRTPSMMV